VSRRHELTDAEWQLLESLLPPDPTRGGRWRDHRTVISAILFRERTGVTWRDLPERFGPWKTVYQRKRRWAMDGTWVRICDALRIDCDVADGREWTVSVDTSSIRVHQHAAGARHAPAADHPKRGRRQGTKRADESASAARAAG
jgi:transposase